MTAVRMEPWAATSLVRRGVRMRASQLLRCERERVSE